MLHLASRLLRLEQRPPSEFSATKSVRIEINPPLGQMVADLWSHIYGSTKLRLRATINPFRASCDSTVDPIFRNSSMHSMKNFHPSRFLTPVMSSILVLPMNGVFVQRVSSVRSEVNIQFSTMPCPNVVCKRPSRVGIRRLASIKQ